MTSRPRSETTIIPTLRYRDAPAAVEWLRRAFGFAEELVVPGEEGTIAHAQLSFGSGMIMLGSLREDRFGRYLSPPAERGGVGSQSAYVVVEDADAHHARAVDAGAEIVAEPEDWEHGGRGYACLDPEGNLWHFGTYDPWAESRS